MRVCINDGRRLVIVIWLVAATALAGGKCVKCKEVWDQPWAKDLKVCPVCGGKEFAPVGPAKEDAKAGGVGFQHLDRAFATYYKRRRALCIGINDYRRTDYRNLELAVGDAKAMAGLFLAHGFDEVTVLADADAARQRILDELLRLKAESTADDLIVVYFSGHGVTVEPEEGPAAAYLVPQDGKHGREEVKAISLDLLRDIAGVTPSRHFLFLLDACFSGVRLVQPEPDEPPTSGPEALTERLRAKTAARAVLLLNAGAWGQRPGEHGGHGRLTYFLLQELGGRTASGADGVVWASELAAAAKAGVESESKGDQTPHFGCLEGGADIAFVTGRQQRPPPTPRAKETFEQLQARVEREYVEVERLTGAGDSVGAERLLSRLYYEYVSHGRPWQATQVRFIRGLTRLLLQLGHPVYALRLREGERRYDIGNFESYFRAFIDFALTDEKYGYMVRQYLKRRAREI